MDHPCGGRSHSGALTGIRGGGRIQQPVMEEYGLEASRGRSCLRHPSLRRSAWGASSAAFWDSCGPRCASSVGSCSTAVRADFVAAPCCRAAVQAGFFLTFSIPAGLGTAFLYPSISPSSTEVVCRTQSGLCHRGHRRGGGLFRSVLTVLWDTAVRGFGSWQGIRGRVLGTGEPSRCHLP